MKVFEAVRTVLAVREFQKQPVPDDTIRRIIESAHLTASSMNGQPWHFVIVTDPATITKLGSIVNSGSYTAQAPFAIVVAIDKSSPFGISDASRAIQSMVLTAWEEGVGSNWTGWTGMTKVASLLGVPDSHDVIAVVPFGYPAYMRNQGKKRRKALSEIAHKEFYGRPFN